MTVAGGSEVYATLFRADGITLRLEDPNAYMIVDDVRYDPNSKGIIEVEIDNPEVTTPNNLIIGNTGVTEATFTVKLLLPQGTFSNPHTAQLGNLTVDIAAGNEQGVYYTWTAPAEGVFTITVTAVPEEKFDIQLYNLNSYAVRTLGEEELLDESGNRYVSVKVSAGDVVSIGYMSVPDENYKYPAVTISTALSFVEGSNQEPTHVVTVKDAEGNPMAGITINLTVDGVNMEFVSNEEGVIAMYLPASIYTVKVTVPEGYQCDTTQFLLTTANPNKDIVMTLYVPQEVTYTVYVVDDMGNPVPNAMVVMGGSFAYTDANGMYSLVLLEGEDYVVTVVPPEGYTIDKNDYAFGTKTTITVVVHAEEEKQEELDYQVKVVDTNGNPCTNLLVRFESEDGSISFTEPVDAQGIVNIRMVKGNYTVTLVFPTGNTMGYEPTTAKLTANNPAITIEVVPGVAGESEMLYVNGGDYEAIYVTMGNHYVDLNGTEIRYFFFTPEETGIYTFTTTNANAAIGYWSTSFFAFNCSAEYVKDNVCTLEVKSVGPTYVISVSGGEGIVGTILKIARASDVQQDTMVYETYEGTTTPTKPLVVSETGTKTYFDLAQSYNLVKGDDGLYHIGTADGPVVYIDLTGARYGISISALINNSAMLKYEYNADGKPIKRTDYTPCMSSYVENVDEKLGVYALTDDLMTIMQNHGVHAGWYDKDNRGYLFGEDTVLEGNGWMFLLCTFQ